MNNKDSTPLPLIAPNPTLLPPEDLAEMLAAGQEAQASMCALERVGLNLVGEVLKDQGEFIELEHYPRDDVFDNETGSQYYYHAHRSDADEHGHFHTFIRTGSMGLNVQPLDYPLASEARPQGADAIGHLIGISMDNQGRPIGLFSANRWVTDDSCYPAKTLIGILPDFSIDHAWPSWPVNRWISAMLRLFRPHIQALLLHHDEEIASWQLKHPGEDVFEDRNLDLTGYLPISVDAWIESLKQASA